MRTRSWRRAWPVLQGMLAELIWLHPATAAFFRTSVAERAAERVAGRVAEDAPEGVVHAVPRAA